MFDKHGYPVFPIWRCNQTRAVAHSRSTVAQGDSQCLRDLRRRQAAKEFHLHDLSLALVNAQEFVERVVQSQEIRLRNEVDCRLHEHLSHNSGPKPQKITQLSLTESCKTFGVRFTCVRGMLYSRNLLRLRLLFVA